MLRVARQLVVSLVRTYERVQVELHGKYSIERVAELHAYQKQFSTRHCLALLMATPLPCLAIIVLTDLVPLEPPSAGPTQNRVLFGRVFFVAFAITATLLEQGRQFVPGLPCSNVAIVAMSVWVAVCTAAYGMMLALVVGFPVPFMVIACSPSFCSTLAILGAIKWGSLVRAHKPLRQALLAYVKIMVVQFALTAIYPAYNYLFLQYDGLEQTAVAMLLPVLKLLAKNAVSLTFNPKLEDFKPEVVILNVEVFHALFVACCMQGSTSWATTIALMGTDFIHARFGLLDIDSRLRQIEKLEAKLRIATHKTQKTGTAPLSLIERALYFARSDSAVRTDPSVRRRPRDLGILVASRWVGVAPLSTLTSTLEQAPSSVTPAAPTKTLCADATETEIETRSACGADALTTRERIEYVSTTLQVLHIAEFLLLIEFVEVVIPVIYSVYMTAVFYLPNRVFYPQLAQMSSHSLFATVGSVLGYAALEFVSFVGLSVALKRKLRFSPVHQLAFVVQTQWNLVQSKMILWVVFAVHVTLEHFGYDYSFRFAWLRKP